MQREKRGADEKATNTSASGAVTSAVWIEITPNANKAARTQTRQGASDHARLAGAGGRFAPVYPHRRTGLDAKGSNYWDHMP